MGEHRQPVVKAVKAEALMWSLHGHQEFLDNEVHVIVGEFSHKVVGVRFDRLDGRVFLALGSQHEVPVEVRRWADGVQYIDPFGFVEQGAL